jgi:four helix bundle protein
MESTKKFDLEERARNFAIDVRNFIKKLPRSISTIEYGKQLIRSSGSIGANYIEANEALGKKDFSMHMKICRKESKESRHWLALLDINEKSNELVAQRKKLMEEALELVKIFNSIVRKSV